MHDGGGEEGAGGQPRAAGEAAADPIRPDGSVKNVFDGAALGPEVG